MLRHAESVPCAYQGQAATAELAALVHDVAGLVGLLLTPDVPPAAKAQLGIDRSVAVLPVLTCLEAPFEGRLQAKAGYSDVAGLPCTPPFEPLYLTIA